MRLPPVSLCACGSGVEICYTTRLHCRQAQASNIDSISAVDYSYDILSADFLRSITSTPAAFPELLIPFMPYILVLVLFGVSVHWNGGIVLGAGSRRQSCLNLTIAFHIVGDKANHVAVLHVPQLYYFIAFATLMGWPAVIFGSGGLVNLGNEVTRRMFGTKGSVGS